MSFSIIFRLKDKEEYVPYRITTETREEAEEEISELDLATIKKISIIETVTIEYDYKFNKKTKKLELKKKGLII